VKWTAAPILGIVIMAACGSGKSATSGSPPTTGKPTVPSSAAESREPPPSKADLRAALLTVDDMPSGWAVSPPDKSTNNDDTFCPAAKGTKLDFLSAGESVTFVPGTIAPLIAEGLTAERSNANQKYDALVESLRKCEGQTWTSKSSDGTVSTDTLQPESFDKYGDESHAWGLTSKQQGGTATVDIVLIRKGDVLTAMVGFSIISFVGSGQLDPKVFSDVTATAVNKVKF
jgi:hypothetical protein